jgi:hypothetical protein
MNNGENELVIANPDQIRPGRPLLQHEIDEVIQLHQILRTTLMQALNIGFRLQCWKDLLLIRHFRRLRFDIEIFAAEEPFSDARDDIKNMQRSLFCSLESSFAN